jgi:hypothetical protein
VSDRLQVLRVDSTKVMGGIRPLVLVVVIAVCGPPLTQPSSQNLTGRWTSADHIGPVFNLEMIIRQNSDGTIVGTWSSHVAPVNPACPPGLGDTVAAGIVSGTNTVLEVRLAVLGAGDFQGQAIDSSTIRGGFQSCGNDYVVKWSLAGPAPAG